MNHFLLIDWPTGQNKFWLADELDKLGCNVNVIGIQNYNPDNIIVRWRKILLWLQYLLLGLRAIRESEKGDVIISWNFVVGAIVGFLNRFLRARRKVISLNMIVHQKKSINSVLRNIIYRYVLKSEEFFITLNTDNLVNLYKHHYNISIKNFAQLPDVLFDSYDDIPFDEGDGTIFSGGEATRDWKTLLEVAAMNPELSFQIIARKKYFPQEIQIPRNVNVTFDTTEDVFYTVLKTCSVVALPLASAEPSGLIVLLRAAMLSRPIITTSTPSVRNYITHKKTGVLVDIGDARTFSDELNILIRSPDIRKNYANECKHFIKANFTPRKYAEKIITILKSKRWI